MTQPVDANVIAIATFILGLQDGLRPEQTEAVLRRQFPDMTDEQMAWATEIAMDHRSTK